MFIISLTYVVPLEKVEECLNAHIEYLKEQYKHGYFLASGRKNPRTGGVILADVKNRHILNDIIEKDPFNQNQIAKYDITEFEPSMTCKELKFLLQQ